MQRLTGKVAIVTGAGTGIGQGIAKRLGAEGANVVIDYVGDPAGAKETCHAVRESGSEAEMVRADVTNSDDIRNLIDTAWTRFGSADILVNNAGMELKADF